MGRRLGTSGSAVSLGITLNDRDTGEISRTRFTYRVGTIVAAGRAGAQVGGPWGLVLGAAIGGASLGAEYLYADHLVPLGTKITNQILNFENAIKNGWYPGR
ncbi:hypothetical protein EYV94_28505 [Puteibacter caeruleilacunae]|nr:hypothetical protein EYV94_28505 [Puteibacter caeruleilacunae]